MVRHGVFALAVAAVGFACFRVGDYGARALEQLLVDRVEHGLSVLELDWASVQADGLRLELRGHAPDAFARDLALESARATAQLATVIDHSTIRLAPPPRPKPVFVEMLRDETGLTLTGRFHGEPMRASLLAALSTAAPGLELHDLTGVNAARPSAGWGAELEIATLAAARVENAYVRVEPGAVQVSGLVPDAEHRRKLSVAMLALAGDKVALTLKLREPLRVAAPFAFDAVKDVSGGLRVESCAGRDYDEATLLETALKRFGADPAKLSCPAALGGPSGNWAGAVQAGLQALDSLPAGQFRLEYLAADLRPAPPTKEEEIAAARLELAAMLPDGYALLPAPDGSARPAPAEPGPYWIRFRKAPGFVELSGLSAGATERRLVETYAATLFGGTAVRSALAIGGPNLPKGWEVAALAALDALAPLPTGEAELAPERITIRGAVAGPVEAGRLHRQLAGVAPSGYAVTTALTIDLPAQVAAVPFNLGRCAAALGDVVAEQPIGFAPGSAVFEPGSQEALDRLGDVFGRCAPGKIEIGGHTDSQGSTELNQRLSTARAEAVLDALLARAVPLESLSAKGYGEAEPVASNETEAGRALNRRIEFRALQ
jgi:OOP family OmpA-OmpF porin